MKLSFPSSRPAIALALSLIAFTTPAFSGEVAGQDRGGGGVMAQNPVEPSVVEQSIQNYAARILVPWIRNREYNTDLSQLPADERSAYAKLFAKPGQIYKIVTSTPIEVRLKKPCLDANGTAWDGSIYASRPGAICISPFLMAPKLDKYSVNKETIALVLHEMSHLVGTTEPEAITLQKAALNDFVAVDFDELLTKEDRFVEADYGDPLDIDSLIRDLDRYGSAKLTPVLTKANIDDIEKTFNGIETKINFFAENFWLISKPTWRDLDPQFPRLDVSTLWVCTQDKTVPKTDRADCLKKLKAAFAGKQAETAGRIWQNEVTTEDYGLPEFNFLIPYPKSTGDIRVQLSEVRKVLLPLYEELKWIASLKNDVYEK